MVAGRVHLCLNSWRNISITLIEPKGGPVIVFFVPRSCSRWVWPARHGSSCRVSRFDGVLSQSSSRTEHSTVGFVPCTLSALSSFRSSHRRRDRHERFLLRLV